MSNTYDALFQPIQIAGVTLKNRICHTAMGGTGPFTHESNQFEEGIQDYYRALAKGGVGLIVPGVTQIKSGSHYLYEYEDVFKGPLKETVDEIHSYGAKYFLQIGAGFGRTQLFGIDSKDPEIRNTLLVAPSDGIPNVWVPALKHRGLSREEIKEIVKAFGKVAKLCKEIGIDGIELHAVHEGYLLDQFAIKNTNYRNDEYGGSLKNRLRFACELIQEIHKVNGDDYPVSVRYSVASKMRGFNAGALPMEDYEEFGRSLEESPLAAKILEEAGCNMLNADNGSYDSWWWAHPPVYMPLHCNFPEVSFIKNYVNIPVFCAGRMEDPDFSNKAIAAGEIDGIGVARQFLADPNWVNKVKEGRVDEIRPCIACHNGCFPIGKIPANDGRDFIMGHCALRPASRAEKKWTLVKTENPKNIAIVGGGIAGMEAARVLTLRGHKVTLFEKTNKLGGVFIAAAAPSFKEKDKMLIKWYEHQLELLNIDIRLNTEATVELLDNYDHILIATGAKPRQLKINGIDNSKVLQATEYLLNEKPVGNKVVIIGGGLTGMEICYQLSLENKEPVVIEMQKDILQVPGLCAANSDYLREIVRLKNLDVRVNTSLLSIEEADNQLIVNVKDQDEIQTSIAADSVILSVGYISDTSLADALIAQGNTNVIILGDANKVANVMTAIYAANRIAYSL